MRVAIYILKIILIKIKGKSAAQRVKERLQQIKKILVKDTTLQEIRIRKESK